MSMRQYHVYAVGNALLDRNVIVDDTFLTALKINKGVMTLTDDKAHHRLTEALETSQFLFCYTGCGGSAANSIVALSQLGGRGFFSCQVANDVSGRLFLAELKQLGIHCNLDEESLPRGITGQCLVLVTEDAQRTMHTHLGISETLSVAALNFDAIANSEYLYLEGYLVTSPTARQALMLAKTFATTAQTKVALTLSDPNIVRYFKRELLSLMEGGIELLFCNEEEVLLFTETTEINDAIAALRVLTEQAIITRGPKGAIYVNQNEILTVPVQPIYAIDTVGAGDMFAGVYLYAMTNGYAPKDSIHFANESAAAVVCQYGPRLQAHELQRIKKNLSCSVDAC